MIRAAIVALCADKHLGDMEPKFLRQPGCLTLVVHENLGCELHDHLQNPWHVYWYMPHCGYHQLSDHGSFGTWVS
jgi:hypothetical protein